MLPAGPAAAQTCPPPSTATAPSKISAQDVSQIIRTHNYVLRSYIAQRNRAVAPLRPLTWSTSLADQAQGWANIIGPLGQLCHSNSGQGENLADAPSVGGGVSLWVNEGSLYQWPTPITAGAPYLHYTQMVWRNSTYFGCGEAPSARYPGNVVLVCRYSPAGNIVGQVPY